MYDSIGTDRKSLWYSYLNVVIANCIDVNFSNGDFIPLTSECHEENVIKLLKTKSFDKLKINWV